MPIVRMILLKVALFTLFFVGILPRSILANQEAGLTVQFLTGEFTVIDYANKGVTVIRTNGDVKLISEGAVIIEYNQKMVRNLTEFQKAIASGRGRRSVLLLIEHPETGKAFVALQTLSGNAEKKPQYESSVVQNAPQRSPTPTPAPAPPPAPRRSFTPLELLQQAARRVSSRPLYYVSLVEPSCHQITRFRGGDTSTFMMAGNAKASTIDFTRGDLVIQRELTVKKEYLSDSLRLARRCGVQRPGVDLRFSKGLKSKTGEYLWQFENTSRSCATRALYTDCTVECVEWLPESTAAFFIVEGIEVAHDLLHRRDRSKSCIRQAQ